MRISSCTTHPFIMMGGNGVIPVPRMDCMMREVLIVQSLLHIWRTWIIHLVEATDWVKQKQTCHSMK